MKNRNLDHKDNWQTPPEFLKKYGFDDMFDHCPLNHDLSKWDGLKVDWQDRNYINPPYSIKGKTSFVKKAIEQARFGKRCFMLLPVSTSTVLYHDYIKPQAYKIEMIRGRIPFIGINDKGQRVNWHLIQDVDKNETFEYWTYDSFDKATVTLIPRYIRNSGQHDSMIAYL